MGTAQLILPVYLISGLLFFCPGLLFSFWLVRRQPQLLPAAVPLAILGGALLGYLAFWIYFYSPGLGRLFAIVTILPSGALAGRRYRQFLTSRDVAGPLLLTAVIGSLYLALLFSIHLGFGPEIQARHRFLGFSNGHDNTMPLLVAELLYAGADLRATNSEWRNSERPPLQTGIFALQRPVLAICGVSVGLHYQALGTFLQCSWIGVVWCFCRFNGASVQQAAKAVALVALSGFILYNSVYTWPKLLSGSLASTAGIIALQRRPMLLETLVIVASAMLSLLAHPGSIFFLAALGLLPLLPAYRPHTTAVALGTLLGALLVAPWIAYQQVYDPSENRLLKVHVAGFVDTKLPVLEVIRVAYGRAAARDVVDNKIANAATLIGPLSLHQIQGSQYHHLAWALGTLNLGWPLLLRRCPKQVKTTLALCVASLGIWILIMFGPATTVLHHGAYSCFLLLFAVLAWRVATAPSAVFSIILLLQAAGFLWFWVLDSPDNLRGEVNGRMVVMTACTAILLVATCSRLWSGAERVPSGEPPAPC